MTMPMEPLERNILDRLAKAREHRETNVDLTRSGESAVMLIR
jgi:hypothetical protein